MSEFTDLENLKQEVENLKKILLTFINITTLTYDELYHDQTDWYSAADNLNSKYRQLEYIAIDLLENNNTDKCYDKYNTVAEISGDELILLKLWDKNKRSPDADRSIMRKNYEDSEMNMERFKTENPEKYNEYYQEIQQMAQQIKLKNEARRMKLRQEQQQKKAQEEERIKLRKERDERRIKWQEEETNTIAVGGRKTRKNIKSKKIIRKI